MNPLLNETLKCPTSQILRTAEVIEAEHGRPIRLIADEGILSVTAVSHHLPYIEPGDQVVFTLIDKTIIVLHQLQTLNQHRPAYLPEQNNHTIKIESNQSSISLQADGEISIKVNDNQLTLDNKGGVVCQGQQITFEASRDITLTAPDNQLRLTTNK